MKLVVSFIENFISKASVRVSTVVVVVVVCCLILHVLRLRLLPSISYSPRRSLATRCVYISLLFSRKKNPFIQCFHSQFSFKSSDSLGEAGEEAKRNCFFISSSSDQRAAALFYLLHARFYGCPNLLLQIDARLALLIGFNALCSGPGVCAGCKWTFNEWNLQIA